MGHIGRYFEEINILRSFAILAVISIHVSAYFTRMNTINILSSTYMSIDVFSHFAVPLFVFVSGFVLYNKYPNITALKNFYKKRLISVFPQYLIISTFYLVATYVGSIVFAKSVNLDILHIIYQYLTGGCFYHLWFFVLIIQLYLLYPLIVAIYNYFEARGRTLELLIAVFLSGVLYYIFLQPEISTLGIATTFIGCMFYFILGMAVQSKYDELQLKSVPKLLLYCMSIPLLCCTMVSIFDYAQRYFNFDISQFLPIRGEYWHWLTVTITPLYYISIFTLCFYIALNIPSSKRVEFKVLDKIGTYSFGIYLIHAFILEIIILSFPLVGFDWNNWLFYPLTCSITLILSYLSVDLIQRIPYSKYIIGSTK